MDKEINELELLIKKAAQNNKLTQQKTFLGIKIKHLSIAVMILILCSLSASIFLPLLLFKKLLGLALLPMLSMPPLLFLLCMLVKRSPSIEAKEDLKRTEKSLAILLKNHKKHGSIKKIAKDFLSIDKNNMPLSDLYNIMYKINKINEERRRKYRYPLNN